MVKNKANIEDSTQKFKTLVLNENLKKKNEE